MEERGKDEINHNSQYSNDEIIKTAVPTIQ
jgi:hypothetical protein